MRVRDLWSGPFEADLRWYAICCNKFNYLPTYNLQSCWRGQVLSVKNLGSRIGVEQKASTGYLGWRDVSRMYHDICKQPRVLVGANMSNTTWISGMNFNDAIKLASSSMRRYSTVCPDSPCSDMADKITTEYWNLVKHVCVYKNRRTIGVEIPSTKDGRKGKTSLWGSSLNTRDRLKFVT